MYLGLHVKCTLLSDLNVILFFIEEFSKNSQTSKAMKVRLVGADLFHADRRTNTHVGANSTFSLFFQRA
jgi:hypothetical protein